MDTQLTIASPLTPPRAELEWALDALEQVRRTLLDRERGFAAVLAELPADARPSARNLVHYLGLRVHDLEPVQRVLAAHGLSSLGRAEPHVLANLDAVLRALRSLASRAQSDEDEPAEVAFADGERLRSARADALFGPAPAGRRVRIMATMPTEAATDFALVRDLVAGGMNCMRINCAHDGPEAWTGMVENLRRAREELGRPCAVLMDLPGPRVRTGEVQPGPRVVKIRPQRDELGRVLEPARVWLTAADAPVPPPAHADAVLPLPQAFLAGLKAEARLRFRDARGARRRMRVEETAGGGAWVALAKTAYVTTGTVMRVRGPKRDVTTAEVGELPPLRRKLHLAPGDTLVLTRDPAPGRDAVVAGDGAVVEPARIPCAPPEALACVRPGARVWFDDGHIGGVVSSVDDESVRVRITHARGGGKLGAEKGVNCPDTDLRLPALMPEDLRILPFICGHADLAGYSFARTAADVRSLRQELEGAGAPEIGVILKIETTSAFLELPMMLLEALRCRAAGVMIARGDLAVEVGFERLAEVQEEILWMCEAAHVPVVWATQVLEQLTREGSPSRAEVSDAALGERAECVMLNKGPYLADAVRTLDDILSRMHRHQEKKRPILAHLGVADHFFGLAPVPARPSGLSSAVAAPAVPSGGVPACTAA
jgi:pyruvate kinase